MLMSPSDEDEFEAEYWDDILKEFGVEAYAEIRYKFERGVGIKATKIA